MAEDLDSSEKALFDQPSFREIQDGNVSVKVYDTEGQSFWKFVTDSKETLKRNTRWAFACEGGLSRSAKAIEGFKRLGIPTTVRSRNIKADQGTGIDYPSLGLLISDGKYDKTSHTVIPEDFDTGFNILAVFYRDPTHRTGVLNYLNKTINHLAQKENNGQPLGIQVVLIEATEEENRKLVKQIT